MKKIPVLFVIFNREDITLQSLVSIKQYRPDRLYITADGPRAEKPEEYILCENTRNSVLKAIDWNCDCCVFQTDSDIVRSVYENNPNYRIEYSADCQTKDFCTIYFASNNIYYPNSENIFHERIVKRDFYEWYSTRVMNA
jgi:hypothetical protein